MKRKIKYYFLWKRELMPAITFVAPALTLLDTFLPVLPAFFMPILVSCLAYALTTAAHFLASSLVIFVAFAIGLNFLIKNNFNELNYKYIKIN